MSVTLRYSSTYVYLRNPDPGNAQRKTLGDIRRFTRSGDFRGVSDTLHWTTFMTYVYKFSALTNVLHSPPDPITDYLIDQLKSFLKATAGKEILFQLHNSVVWKNGYIYTPINEIISERPDCTFNVSFELMEKP